MNSIKTFKNEPMLQTSQAYKRTLYMDVVRGW